MLKEWHDYNTNAQGRCRWGLRAAAAPAPRSAVRRPRPAVPGGPGPDRQPERAPGPGRPARGARAPEPDLASLELRVDGALAAGAPGAGEPSVDILAAPRRRPWSWPRGALAHREWSTTLRFTVGSGSTSSCPARTRGGHPCPGRARPDLVVSSLGPPGSFSVPAQGSADLWIASGCRTWRCRVPRRRHLHLRPGAIRGYEGRTTGYITGTLTGRRGRPSRGRPSPPRCSSRTAPRGGHGLPDGARPTRRAATPWTFCPRAPPGAW